MDTSRTSWWIASPVWAPGHSADSSVYGQQVAGLCQQGRQDPADAGTANRLPTGEYRPVPGCSSATAPAIGEGACTQPRRTAGASALLAVPTRKTWSGASPCSAPITKLTKSNDVRHLLHHRGWRCLPSDLPSAPLVRLESGHFAVEDSLDQIAEGIKDFYDKQVA
jgi:hypothetical protein